MDLTNRTRGLERYGLRVQPFIDGPNTRFGDIDHTRRDALAALYLGVLSSRNLLTLVGAEGMGKTRLLQELVGRLDRTALVVFLSEGLNDPGQLLRRALAGCGHVSSSDDVAAMRDELCRVASDERAAGRRVVLVVDDAHLVPRPVLLELERLSAAGTPQEWIQVVLSGQPSLTIDWQTSALRRLRQRATMVPGLDPLSSTATAAYVAHRLMSAGYTETTPLFTREALARITIASDGVPRRIDAICRRSLALAAATDVQRIGRPIVEVAIKQPEADTPTSIQERAVEAEVQPLPMAVGQGSMLFFPAQAGASGSGSATPGDHRTHLPHNAGPVAELTPVLPSPPMHDAIVHAGPWRLHPAIEEAVRPSDRRAPAMPTRRDADTRPSRRSTPPADPQPPVDAAAAAPEKTPVAEPAERQDERLSASAVAASAAYTVPNNPELSKLVASLLATQDGTAPRGLLFVSVDQGAHTAQLCADVAKIIAAAGSSRVLVVDADRGTSALHEQFGRAASAGLSDVLDGRLTSDAATIRLSPTLSLLTAGLVARPGSSCLLPHQISELVTELKSHFDYVLVNGMPLDAGGDSIEFGRNADGVLMVVGAHATRRDAARHAKDQLEAVGARILGAVLTDRLFPVPDALYRRL